MSPFFNDWYACFIQITTIRYIMTFISNPRILTSRSRLIHIKVWEKFGSFRSFLNGRDGSVYVSHFQNKNFKTALKEGGQCTKRANSLSCRQGGPGVLMLTKVSVFIMTVLPYDWTKFTSWENITYHTYCHLFQVKEDTMEILIFDKEID